VVPCNGGLASTGIRSRNASRKRPKNAVQLSAVRGAPLVAFLVSRLWSQTEELQGDAHIETDATRDEYPIRHAWTFVIPPTAEQFAASKER
jgi:hypothetical protein